MKDLSGVQVVVTQKGVDGKAHFIEAAEPFRFEVPGFVETRFVWSTEVTPHLPDGMGGPPPDMSMSPPGGTKFGITCFAPHSAGRTDPSVSAGLGVDVASDGMHGHPTMDYEVVISGKIDLVLDSGEVRTLTPGTMLVLGGTQHAWRNIYDEPCIFASITVGATGSGT
jgi:hypothetical protein